MKILSWKFVGNLLLGLATDNFSAVLAYLYLHRKKFINLAKAFLSILKKSLNNYVGKGKAKRQAFSPCKMAMTVKFFSVEDREVEILLAWVSKAPRISGGE